MPDRVHLWAARMLMDRLRLYAMAVRWTWTAAFARPRHQDQAHRATCQRQIAQPTEISAMHTRCVTATVRAAADLLLRTIISVLRSLETMRSRTTPPRDKCGGANSLGHCTDPPREISSSCPPISSKLSQSPTLTPSGWAVRVVPIVHRRNPPGQPAGVRQRSHAGGMARTERSGEGVRRPHGF